MCAVVFTKPCRRGPVWLGLRPQADAQGAIPARWCEGCGAEVFTNKDRLCCRCEDMRKERGEHEEQSLSDLYPGGGPGQLRE